MVIKCCVVPYSLLSIEISFCFLEVFERDIILTPFYPQDYILFFNIVHENKVILKYRVQRRTFSFLTEPMENGTPLGAITKDFLCQQK